MLPMTDAGAGMPGEHHADPAYCSGGDHSPDAGNMVSTCAQVGLPSEEAIARTLIAYFVDRTGFQTINEDDTKTSVAAYYGGSWVDLRVYPMARAILALMRPAFEAKEREIGQHAEEDLAAEASLDLWRQRALSAEAKLAQAVEAPKVVQCIAEVAAAVGWQANVGASETAGLIVSVLAANPEQIGRFMEEGSELFIDGTMRAENGCLSHRAINGQIVEPTKLREIKGQSQ